MLSTILKKIFGNKSARDVKRLIPLVQKIRSLDESYMSLTDEQLCAKTQEFKDRKTYDVDHSSEVHAHDGACCSCGEKKNDSAPKLDEILLFTSPTCPNCKMAKMMLDQKGIHYHQIDALSDKEMTKAYGVKQAPTLIVPNGDSYKTYENASLIKGYIDEASKN